MGKLLYFHLKPKQKTNKNKKLTLRDSKHLQLTTGFRTYENQCFRMCCRTILPKAGGLGATQVREQTEMTAHTVGSWGKRFENKEIKRLYTCLEQGRQAIMGCSEEKAVHKAMKSDRQSVRAAKEAWQNASGKEARESTFKRFLFALAQDIDV